MSWIFLSVACAFFSATAATLSKAILKTKSEIFTIWVISAFALPVFLAIGIFNPPPNLTPSFWKTVAVLLPLELGTLFLYMRSIKRSPLSLVFPLLGLTPVFTIATSRFILREKLPFWGIAGVLIITAGAYLLNADKIKYGLLEPIKSIYREKGAMLMIFVAFLFSLCITIGKRAILLSGPLTFPAIYYSIYFAILTPVAYLSIKKGKVSFYKKDILLFLAAGACFSVMLLLHFKAVILTNVSYMVSVKRLSLVFGVIYGAVIFKERNITYRLLGASVMFGGIVVLALTQ